MGFLFVCFFWGGVGHFSDSSFILLLVRVAVLGVVLYFRIFSVLCLSPVTSGESPFSNANFPSWAAIGSWSAKDSDVTTEHHSFATVLLPCDSSTKKPNKIFKVFFEKASSNVCLLSERASLYLVTHGSLTCLM